MLYGSRVLNPLNQENHTTSDETAVETLLTDFVETPNNACRAELGQLPPTVTGCTAVHSGLLALYSHLYSAQEVVVSIEDVDNLELPFRLGSLGT